MNINIVDEYFKFKDLIHKSFNYVADWKEIPLEDGRKYYWMLVGDEINGTLVYGNELFTAEDLGPGGGNFFTAQIYTQRFLEKYVYINNNYTMISIDTRTDGNKFLIILDNELECKDNSFKEIYKKNWGNI